MADVELNCHSDVTKWGTFFSLASKILYVVGLFTHLKNSYFIFLFLLH